MRGQHSQGVVKIDSDDSPTDEVPEGSLEIPYPEIPPGSEYLVALFHSAGAGMPTGMGLIPLSWQEIEAWVRCNGLEDSVTPWELQTIKRLSEAYAAEYSQSRDPKRKMPYSPKVEIENVDRDAVADKVANVLGGFKKK